MNYSEADKAVLPVVFLAMVAVVAILALILWRRSERIRAIPTAIVAIALIFIEIVKQRWNILGDFDLYFLPFHYCSLFFIVIPLAELCGPRMSRIFRPIATCMAFMVSAAMYVYPQGIMGTASENFGVNFKQTHGFIFHHLVVLYLLLVIGMRLGRPRWRDALRVGLVGAVYCALAIPLAHNFQSNYCNFLDSVIPAVENMRLEYGQLKYTLFIAAALTLGAIFSAFICIGLDALVGGFFKLLSRIKPKNNSLEQKNGR